MTITTGPRLSRRQNVSRAHPPRLGLARP